MKETIELIRESVSDKEVLKQIEAGLLQQARKTAIILGSFLIVGLLGVVYGFVQNTAAKETSNKIGELQTQIEAAKVEAEKQAAYALESKMVIEEAAELTNQRLEVALNQLKDCQEKK